MRTKCLRAGIIVTLVIITVILSTYIVHVRNNDPVISEEEAGEILHNRLIELYKIDQWEEEVVLEQQLPHVIGDSDAYCFDLRYAESDRLIGSYAIAVDGNNVLCYDPADDEWITLEYE